MTTKVPAELSSTPSIVDNGDATAITITSDENVRIGATTTDIGILEVAGSKSISSGIPLNQFTVTDTAANAAGVGGALLFLGRYNSGGAFTSLASVEASKESATSGEYGSSLVFKTRTNGSTNDERGRFLSSGGLTFNGDTAAANALDDYEEGTWTPQITGSAGSAGTAAYSNQMGRYTKIGNKVFFEFQVVMTNKGSWTSYTRVLGFPFTANSTGVVAFSIARFPDNDIGSNMVGAEVQPNTNICFFTTGSRLDTLHNITNVDTGYYLIGAGHYSI